MSQQPSPKLEKDANIDPLVQQRNDKFHWTQNVEDWETKHYYTPCGQNKVEKAAYEKIETDKVKKEAYLPGDEKYKRVIPTKYTGQSGDSFMANIIKNYAVEGGKKEGKPNGAFWFEPLGAKKASQFVMKSYMHMSDTDSEVAVCARFNSVWDYLDVNKEGKIDADRMPRFFR